MSVRQRKIVDSKTLSKLQTKHPSSHPDQIAAFKSAPERTLASVQMWDNYKEAFIIVYWHATEKRWETKRTWFCEREEWATEPFEYIRFEEVWFSENANQAVTKSLWLAIRCKLPEPNAIRESPTDPFNVVGSSTSDLRMRRMENNDVIAKVDALAQPTENDTGLRTFMENENAYIALELTRRAEAYEQSR